MRRPTLIRSAVGGLLFTIGLLLLAAPASADRPLDSNFAEATGADTLAFDASGNVWVTNHGEIPSKYNPGQGGIYEYNAYPSNTLLDPVDTALSVGVGVAGARLDVAVDQSNGEVFTSNQELRTVDIYDEKKEEVEPCAHVGCVYHEFSHKWAHINGAQGCSGECGLEIHIAIDNSHTYSRGRVYLSLNCP